MLRTSQQEEYSHLIDTLIPSIAEQQVPGHYSGLGYTSIPSKVETSQKNVSMPKIPSMNLIRLHDISPRLAELEKPSDKVLYYRDTFRRTKMYPKVFQGNSTSRLKQSSVWSDEEDTDIDKMLKSKLESKPKTKHRRLNRNRLKLPTEGGTFREYITQHQTLVDQALDYLKSTPINADSKKNLSSLESEYNKKRDKVWDSYFISKGIEPSLVQELRASQSSSSFRLPQIQPKSKPMIPVLPSSSNKKKDGLSTVKQSKIYEKVISEQDHEGDTTLND